MSFEPPSKTVRIIDPRMRVNQDRPQYIAIGPKNNTYRVVAADSAQNLDIVNFNYNATSVNDIIDKRFLVKYYLRVTITGTGNPLTSYGVSDALRFLPINSTCTSLAVTINNSTQTVIPYQWLDGVSRYIKMEDLKKDLSSSPSHPDLGTYANFSGPRNVMGSYTENSINSPDLRGALTPVAISEGVNTSTFDFEIVEPLFAPPLAYQDKMQAGFTGVESLSVQLSHNWTGGSTWSHGGAQTLTTFAFEMYSTPQLFINVLSPNELVEPYNRTKTYTYHNFNLRPYITQHGNINASATANISSGNIQLNAIPSRIYIFVRKRKSDRVSTDPDTFLQITGINIAFGNKNGLLASADQRELYRIANKNGYEYSYNAFKNHQGSVLCLKPSEDLSLDLGEAPGLVVQKQLQINVNVLNQQGSANNYELVVIPVLPGAFYLKDGIASQSIGLLSPEKVLSGEIAMSDYEYAMYQNMDVYGSGIFDWIKKALDFIVPSVAGPLGNLALKGVEKLAGLAVDKASQKIQRHVRKAQAPRMKKQLALALKKRGRGLYDVDDQDEDQDDYDDCDEVEYIDTDNLDYIFEQLD